jgi:hypothetical protein
MGMLVSRVSEKDQIMTEDIVYGCMGLTGELDTKSQGHMGSRTHQKFHFGRMLSLL